ncbi:MAG: alkaline phosphatase family protein [Verrucomicrobiota bacterium]|nr:alkaline phosphatase family protein [Verrucomicrobiota bacterium]
MTRTAVINVVGLSDSLLGSHTPNLQKFAALLSRGTIVPAFPAVTCTAQSDYVTGLSASHHGIVGNGWYNRQMAEVQFWKQSNHLVTAPKIWDELKRQDPSFTCAKLFWWYNMYSSADYSITPRPMYPADGRKVFDVYTWPFSIRTEIKKELGEFPFPAFWGPAAGMRSAQFAPDAVSKWIAESAKWIENLYHPTLSLVYLPHLDYNLQRFGPNHPSINEDLAQIDAIVGDLIKFFEKSGVQVIVLSEYGITEVDRPIHLNRLFRQKGWLTIKEELGLELLDAGASKAFAVADHQIAHIYVNDLSILNKVREVISQQQGVEQILGAEEKSIKGIDHERAGDLIAISDTRSWFTYYYWLDDALAPDFARCVDIHRKPGYDPVELFIDPALKFPKLKIVSKLLKKKLGFRMLMDVIPLDANLVKGSHGRVSDNISEQPVILVQNQKLPRSQIQSTEVYNIIRTAVRG